MIGFLPTKKKNSNVNTIVAAATTFADTYNFTDPEQTTYRLRHALNQITDAQELSSSIHIADLMHRGANLPSNLRTRNLRPSDYHAWLANSLESVGAAKQNLKIGLRSQWQDHYDWLGQSLAHSNVLINSKARRAYEQLAITYRIEQHLLNFNKDSQAGTNKNGYQIETAMPISPAIVAKADRLINHYYSPTIIG